MRIVNVHERRLDAARGAAGELIDGLAGRDDRLWPRDRWPAMRFDRPLVTGARGGHGPIAYDVTEYVPATRVRFRFLRPRGLEGIHGFELVAPAGEHGVVLRHFLHGEARGAMRLWWPLCFRPLHDALIEDAFDRAQAALNGRRAGPSRWSLRVRLLRRLLASR